MSIGRDTPYSVSDMEQFGAIAEQLTIIISRKQAEEQLKKERDLAQKYLDTAGVMFIALDRNGRVTMANRKAAEILGYKEDEIVGKDWFKTFVPEEERKAVREVFAKLIAGDIEPVEYYENQVLTRDGQIKIIAWHNAVFTDTSGNIIGTLSSGEDITEKKQIDDALKLTQYSIDHASDIIVWFNTEGTIIYANNAACNILGYSHKELYQKKLFDLDVSFPCEEWPERWQMLKNDGFGTIESLYKTKTGDIFPVEITANFFRYNGNEYSFAVIHDISERNYSFETINKKLEFEQVLSKISSFFVSVTDINQVINDMLAELGRLTCTDRAYLFLLNHDEKTMDNTHEWCAEGVSPQIDNLKNLSLSRFPWWIDHLQNKGAINIPDVSQMSAAASAEKRILENQGIKSVLVSPVYIAGGLNGFIGFDDTRGRNEWSDEAINILRISSEIIGNALEHKRSEDALQLTQFSMDKASISIFWVNPDGRFVYVNDAACLSLGYSNRKLLNMNVSDIDPDFSDEGRTAFWNKLRKKKMVVFESRQRTKDGRLFPVEITANHIVFDDREYNIAFVRDITERKNAENTIRESEEKLRLMFDSVNESIVVSNLEGNIIQVNKSAAKIHGYRNKDDMLGLPVTELISKKDRSIVINALKTGIFSKQFSVSSEFTLLRKNGSSFIAELSSSMLKDSSGSPIGIISVGEDITERKRMQEQLMVTDRLASIGELAAGIAHEMNNPLTGVICFSQLLLEKEIPDDIKEDIAVINHEAQRTAEVVRNLLTFARKHAPIKQLVNVNSIIANVLRLRAYEQKVSNINIIIHLSPELPEVMADNFQLQQVFLNIVINAEHFMTESHGKGNLTVITEPLGNGIKISFSDDGPGIKKKDISRIFDPFFTTKDVGKGTGLGLSICHGIITEHGGRIYTQSDYGKGATFIVELPATR